MHARLQRAAVATLTGVLAVSALTATAAFGQTKADVVAHKTPTLKSLESTLSGLETAPSSVSLTENGSSLFYPLFAKWALNFKYASLVSVTTGNAGSGTGVSDAAGGSINIGTSDAYLSPAQLAEGLINIPEVVSAQMVDYNIPGLSKKVHLKLSSQLLNEIYSGTITNWDNSAIKAINKGIKIPSVPIVTLHRSDSSGDTFLFSSYLSAGYAQSFLRNSGPNDLVNFPTIPGAIAAHGNTGMLQECAVTPGCVAYIGISYQNSAISSGLGIAQLRNAAGKYELPTTATINAEIGALKTIPANGAISIVYLPHAPTGYPIVNFEYAVVKTTQSNANVAHAIQSLLAWGMDPRDGASASELTSVHFRVLPPAAMNVAINLLKTL